MLLRTLSLSIFAFFVSLSSAYSVGVATQPVPPSPTSVSLTYTGPRALRDAIQLLEQQINCVVTYEDPVYDNEASVVELYPSGPVIPRQRTVALQINGSEPLSAQTTVQALLQQDQRLNNTSIYGIKASKTNPSIINVVPVQYENKTGTLVNQSSLLDATVSFSATKSYQAIAEEICHSVSQQSGTVSVMLSRPPNREFANAQVSLSFDKLDARSCLDSLLTEYNKNTNTAKYGTLSWCLDRDPDQHYAAVRFYMIPLMTQAQQIASFGFETARPLRDAVHLLSVQTKQAVIYEDPPWGCSCEVVYDGAGKPEGLRGGVLRYTYSRQSNPVETIQNTVAAYDQQINPGVFSSKLVGQVLYIYPTQNMKVGGDTNIIKMPLLGYSISCSAKAVSLATVVGDICEKLTKKVGIPVHLGRLPSGNKTQITYNATSQQVSKCLVAISQEAGENISWSLLYDPKTRSYRLNGYNLDE